MQLFLLRHANADSIAESDDERVLTEKGIQQAQRVARFCEAHDFHPTLIFTSPIRRAYQTAALVAETLRAELHVVRWLAFGALPAEVLAQVAEYADKPAVMLVGHEPDFGHCIAHLLGMKHAENLRIRKASLTLIQIENFVAGGGVLQFTLPPKLL